jgi:hypothetical protein
MKSYFECLSYDKYDKYDKYGVAIVYMDVILDDYVRMDELTECESCEYSIKIEYMGIIQHMCQAIIKLILKIVLIVVLGFVKNVFINIKYMNVDVWYVVIRRVVTHML